MYTQYWLFLAARSLFTDSGGDNVIDPKCHKALMQFCKQMPHVRICLTGMHTSDLAAAKRAMQSACMANVLLDRLVLAAEHAGTVGLSVRHTIAGPIAKAAYCARINYAIVDNNIDDYYISQSKHIVKASYGQGFSKTIAARCIKMFNNNI